MADQIVHFLRQRDYELIKELGSGACGKTVLLHDSLLDENFVCKKFTPYDEWQREDLFERFVQETKILHHLHNKNIVRVFNYYLYPDKKTGYILMEHISGLNIEEYLKSSPELINEIFTQAVDAFCYLQTMGILHRDIRYDNLLVNEEGILKVIDFGFGKPIKGVEDEDKSVTLNWWCELPFEFTKGIYNFSTEVYFVGKLFERIIIENELDNFQFLQLLGQMCQRDASSRISSFEEVSRNIQSKPFSEIDFSEIERDAYRTFANYLCSLITKIEHGVKYTEDVGKVISELEKTYRVAVLEEYFPDPVQIARCLLRGGFYFKKGSEFPTVVVKEFLQVLKSLSPEKKSIFLANLHNRFDSIARYKTPALTDFEDDIPF